MWPENSFVEYCGYHDVIGSHLNRYFGGPEILVMFSGEGVGAILKAR